MRGINKVILVGNIGKDPEVQYLEGENPIPVAKFPLATTEMRKEKNGGQIPETTWHNIVLWRGLAELAGKYLKKGSLVYLEGKLRNRTFEDKDKNKKFYTEIVADNLIMLDKRKDAKPTDEDSNSNIMDNDFDSDFDNSPNSDLSF